MEGLRQALHARERTQSLLAALDGMRAQGTVTEADYQQMRNQRLLELNESVAAVEAARARLRPQLAAQQAELSAAAQAQQDLALRVKLGEVPAEQSSRDLATLTARAQALQASVASLQAALAAESPDAVPARAAAPPATVPAPYGPPATYRPPSSPGVQQVVDLLGQIPTPQNLAGEMARKLAAAAGAFLALVALVVPAAGASFLGVSVGHSSIVGVGGLGILCLLLSLALAGLYFVEDNGLRAVAQVGVGAFMLLVWLIWLIIGPGLFGHWQFGFYLFFLGLLAALLCGVAQVKPGR